MKLLIVTPWPLASPGGGQHLANGVARSLAADHGFEVVVAAGSGLLSHAVAPIAADGVREVRLPLVVDRGTVWDRGTKVPRDNSAVEVRRDDDRFLTDRGTKVPRYNGAIEGRRDTDVVHVARDFSPAISDFGPASSNPGARFGWQSAKSPTRLTRPTRPTSLTGTLTNSGEFRFSHAISDADPAMPYLEGLDTLAQQFNPDALLFTPHFSSCGQQAAALAERLRIPFLLWPAIHLDHARHTSRAARRFYRSAALVLCLSGVEREWLVRRAGLAPRQVLTLGCGWSGDATRRARAVTPEGPVRLLTVGGYAGHKQLDHQLDALAVLRGVFRVDARLTVAGALREPSVFDRLLTLTRSRGLEGSVDLVTDCADATIAELHAGADFFLFTSASESFGVALLEAIGFGTFPVAYPHPVYRGLIESSGFGALAEGSNPKALAETVWRVLVSRRGRLGLSRDRTRRKSISQHTPHMGAHASDGDRLRWLAERSWGRVTAPLADALAGRGDASYGLQPVVPSPPATGWWYNRSAWRV